MGAQGVARRIGAGPCGQRGQRQRLYRPGRRQGRGAYGRGRRRPVPLPAEHGFPRLHRSHRRADFRRTDRRRPARPEGRPQGERLGRGGGGHHDHRHLPQGGHPHRPDRRRRGHHQRHRQGLGHDRAGYGDHAGLRVHRRQDPGPRPAGFARTGCRPIVQFDHRGRRHLDQRYAHGVRHRPGQAPACGQRQGPGAKGLPRRARRSAPRPRPTGSARRRGRREVRHHRGFRRRSCSAC